MAWPRVPTGTLTGGVIGQGTEVTHMRWGTADAVSTTGWYVITRIAQRLKKEDLQYDNGDGVQSGRVQIIHGTVWDVTVRDNTLMTPPRIGASVTVVDMAGMVGTTKVPGVYYSAYVLDSNYDAAPKQPGERVVVLERIVLIEGP
jgi:hypothetical protein